MSLYTGLAATASRLLETYGQAVTLTRKSNFGTQTTPWTPTTRTFTWSGFAVDATGNKSNPNPQNSKENEKTIYLKKELTFASGPTWTGDVYFFRNDIINNENTELLSFTAVFLTGDTIEVSGALLPENNIQDTPSLIDAGEMNSDNFTDDATVQEVTIALVTADDPVPVPGDTITINGATLQINTVETVAPGGTTLLYAIQARAV